MICGHCLYDDGGAGGRCEGCGRSLEGGGAQTPEPPFVGRARELARLDELLEQVLKNRVPRFVAVVGEPRSGRSRLVKQFRRRHDNSFSDVVTVRGYPVPGGRVADPFAPLGRLLRNAFRIDERATAEGARRSVRQQIEALSPPSLPEALRGLGLLLNLRFPEVPGEAMPGGPEELRRRAFEACTWYLGRRAQERPLLLLVEGLTEATADARALLAHLHGHVLEGRVLVLCEVDPAAIRSDSGWFRPYAETRVNVDPLPRDAVAELMAKLADRMPPPANLLTAVFEATGGRPEDVVQAVRTLERERILVPGAAGWGVDSEGPVRLPFALTPEQAARRRLEKLDAEDRAWLRRAALVGTVFWRGALMTLARLEQGATEALAQWVEVPPPEAIDAALGRAMTAGIVHRMSDSGLPGEVEYAFTRPREQGLLAAELDDDERARMHALLAQWLEYRTGPARDQHLQAIAEHYRRGRNDKRAAFYFILAGDRARRRFANDLAVEAFERALELLDARDALPLLDVHHALGALHALAGRHDLAEDCFERMLGSAWLLDHRAKAAAALNRLGRLYRDRWQHARARTLLEQGRQLFEAADDGPGVAASVDDLGQIDLRQGQREAAKRRFEEALAYRHANDDARSAAVSLTNLARWQRDEGDLVGAETTLRDAYAVREQIGDTLGLVTALLDLSELSQRAGTTEAATSQAEEALALARRTGDRLQTARASAQLALLAAARGDADTARQRADEAASMAEAIGDVSTFARARRAAALVEAARGSATNALAVLGGAVEATRQHGDQLELGHALWLAGSLHARLSGVDLTVAAASAVALGQQNARPENADGGDIDRMIEGALFEADASVPPEVTGLADGARAHLDAAAEAYGTALGALEAAADGGALARALREMALVVTARGELARAQSLAERAAALDAERRSRE